MKYLGLTIFLILSLSRSFAEEEASSTRDEIAQDRSNQYGKEVKFYGCKNCEFSLNTYEEKLRKLDQGGSGYAAFSVLLAAGTYYDSYLSSAINESLGTLTIQLNSIKSELETLKRELSNARENSNHARGNIEAKIRDYQSIERKLNQLTTSFNDLKKRVENSQSGISDCVNGLNSNSKIISDYRTSLPGAEHVPPDILVKHNSNYDSAINNLKEYANLKNQLENINSEVSNSIKSMASQQKNNLQLIQNEKTELSGLDNRLQSLNSKYSDQNNRYTRITDELKNQLYYYEMAKSTTAKQALKSKIDSLQRDARSLESDINRTTSEVRSLSNSYQFIPTRLALYLSLDGSVNNTALKIKSGDSYVGPIAAQRENVCQLRTKDNQEITPLRKFLQYREQLDREISKTPFTGTLKTTIPMKGYTELVYLKTRQDIVMKWNTVEDPDRARQIFQASDQLINFSDDFLSTSPVINETFLSSMKNTISTMQDYGAGALSLAIGFIPYVNHIKDLADVIQGKDTITGEKYNPEIRMVILGAMLLPISATAVKPFVEKIAPAIMGALKIAKNPLTRKILAAAERLGIKETKDIVRNIKLLERIEPDFTNVVVKDADELNSVYTNLKKEPPYLSDTKIIRYTDGKIGNYVRVHNETNPIRNWVMLESEIEGLSNAQILELSGEYNIPSPVTQISRVTTPAGTEFEVSIVGNNGYGTAKGRVQYEIVSDVNKEWFMFWKDL